MTAISHSSTCIEPPRMSRPRSRIGRSWSSLARMAASFSQELVAMQCPVSRSTSIERPRQPSILSSIGPASLLMNADARVDVVGHPLERCGTCVHGPLLSGTGQCPDRHRRLIPAYSPWREDAIPALRSLVAVRRVRTRLAHVRETERRHPEQGLLRRREAPLGSMVQFAGSLRRLLGKGPTCRCERPTWRVPSGSADGQHPRSGWCHEGLGVHGSKQGGTEGLAA